MNRTRSVYLSIAILVLTMMCWPARSAGDVSMLLELPATESAGLGGPDHDFGSDYREQEKETIRKSFAYSAGSAHRVLEIDNVFGSIDVVGGPSNEVQLVVNKTIRAESKAKLEEARKKVTLDITQEGDSLRFYVNGPFRCDCRDCVRNHDDEGYIVQMDFELQIPRDTEIKLKTVNAGNIHVRNVTGDYQVGNVNGGIEMKEIAGSGKVHTVNGPVRVYFRENPRADSDFKSLNGNVELYFQKSLSADFRFKTFNGGVYSDFPVTSLPLRAMEQERRGTKVVFRTDRFSGGRVGSGGPEIRLENLNGDIRILENHD
jgi:putative adhesin